jgi:hypothetical protein
VQIIACSFSSLQTPLVSLHLTPSTNKVFVLMASTAGKKEGRVASWEIRAVQCGLSGDCNTEWEMSMGTWASTGIPHEAAWLSPKIQCAAPSLHVGTTALTAAAMGLSGQGGRKEKGTRVRGCWRGLAERGQWRMRGGEWTDVGIFRRWRWQNLRMAQLWGPEWPQALTSEWNREWQGSSNLSHTKDFQ